MQTDECPLFTSRHAQHSAVWTVPGFSIPKLCLACATERLEDKGQLSLHHKTVLGELLALAGASNSALLKVLTSDKRVLDHLSCVVLGVLGAQDAVVSQLAVEVLSILTTQVSSTDIPRKLMQRTIQLVMTSQSFSASLPHLTFLGRLLHSLPTLCMEAVHSFGDYVKRGFLEYLLNGLAYPEEMVKSAVVYVLVQLCTKTPQNSLPLHLVQSACPLLTTSLASARSHDLTLNILGLVKGLMRSSVYTQCLLQTDRQHSEAKGSTLASAFKRVLLSHDELLQLSGVQCVAEVVAQHPHYGGVLLNADIAEFLFEALTSKKELLTRSIFSCLDSLSAVDDFYLKGHVIYGIEQVISGLSATLSLKNYTAAELGFGFLSKVLSRQPASMPLFSNLEIFQKLLGVINSALLCPSSAVVLCATTTLSCTLVAHHLPPGFPLPGLLPLLSLLLHHLEECLQADGVERKGISSEATQLLTQILSAMEKTNRICHDIRKSKREGSVPEDVTVFLYAVFEENILPSILMIADTLSHCDPLASVFSMATIQLELHSTLASTLALRLASLGFIHFAFDMKSKFFSTSRGPHLADIINKCTESLCYHIESDPHRKNYIKEILPSSLPNINCGLEQSIELLTERAAGRLACPGLHGQTTTNTLPHTQRAVLTLLYYAHTHCDSFGSPQLVLQGLNKYLLLNPDVHLLPAPSLTHLTLLYALSRRDTSLPVSEGSQILVRALLRIQSPTAVFVPNSALLEWAFTEPPLHGVARRWFSEWVQYLCGSNMATGDPEQRESQIGLWSPAIQLLQKSSNGLDVLLNPSCVGGLHSPTLSLIHHLLPEEGSAPQDNIDHRIVPKVFCYLQKVLLAQRLQPLSDADTGSVLGLLARAIKTSSLSPDLKIVFHAINLVTRSPTEHCVDGLHFLNEVTAETKEINSQVLVLLLSNVSFIQRLVSLVPKSPSPQAHSSVSASVLQLIGALIHHQSNTNIALSGSEVKGAISVDSVLATLVHPKPNIQVSGLQLWRAVLSTRGHTGCFVLELVTRDAGREGALDVTTLNKLAFLIQNCLVKDCERVRGAAAVCFNELLKYTTDTGTSGRSVAGLWTQATVSHLTTLFLHSHIPSYYLSCLSAILGTVEHSPSSWPRLRDLAQLLYKSLATCIDQQPGATGEAAVNVHSYTACLREIHRINSSLLDSKQWAHLNTKITIA